MAGVNGSPPRPASLSAARASTSIAAPAGTVPCGSLFQAIVPQVAPAAPASWITCHVPWGEVLARAKEPVISE